MKGSGFHPSDALDKFSDTGLLEELKRLQSEGDVLELMLRLRKPGQLISPVGERMCRYVELQKQVLDTFEAALAAGDLIATGYDSRSASMPNARRKKGSYAGAIGRRTTIPCEMWRGTLELDYEKGTASGGGFEFGALLIRSRSRRNKVLENACIAWLKQEIANGYTPRVKVDMMEKVRSVYGERISESTINSYIWPQVAKKKWTKEGRRKSIRID